MSREGKWRLTTSFLRTCGVAAVLGGVAWGTWEVVRALQENPSKTPESAKAVPVSNLELTTDGVLRPEWLARTLALPKNASLMELDLQALRTRLFASGQVTAANLSKKLPHTLRAQVAERSPIARVRASLRGEEKTLLVARDGVVFEGEGYAEDTLALLPWLDGVKLARADNRFLPLDGIGVVADLLARARLDAAHLYRTWDVVSLDASPRITRLWCALNPARRWSSRPTAIFSSSSPSSTTSGTRLSPCRHRLRRLIFPSAVRSRWRFSRSPGRS